MCVSICLYSNLWFLWSARLDSMTMIQQDSSTQSVFKSIIDINSLSKSKINQKQTMGLRIEHWNISNSISWNYYHVFTSKFSTSKWSCGNLFDSRTTAIWDVTKKRSPADQIIAFVIVMTHQKLGLMQILYFYKTRFWQT